MTQIQYEVQVLKARFITHQRETNGFTWDFQEATDDEVLDTTQVSKDTIDGLANVIMKIIVPNQKKALRNHIAYLIGLQSRQADAWALYIADCQTRTNNTNQWVSQNER